MRNAKLALAALALGIAAPGLAQAGMEPVPARAPGEGEGPYAKLLITGASVIEGTGTPPMGPVDILVEGNRIAQLYPGGAPEDVRMAAQKTVDAKGMFVLPGLSMSMATMVTPRRRRSRPTATSCGWRMASPPYAE